MTFFTFSLDIWDFCGILEYANANYTDDGPAYIWISSPRFTPPVEAKKITSLFPRFYGYKDDGYSGLYFSTLEEIHATGHGEETKEFFEETDENLERILLERISNLIKLPLDEVLEAITGKNAQCLLDFIPDLQEEINKAREMKMSECEIQEHLVRKYSN